MNDRFRFRFWDKETQAMQKIPMVELKHRITLDKIFADDRVIFMQCTGLKDKNGKLIYEGDIVKIPDNWDIYGQFAGEKREVYYNEGFRLKPKWDKNSRGNWLEDTKDLEVIGNIYENKELLDAQN